MTNDHHTESFTLSGSEFTQLYGRIQVGLLCAALYDYVCTLPEEIDLAWSDSEFPLLSATAPNDIINRLLLCENNMSTCLSLLTQTQMRGPIYGAGVPHVRSRSKIGTRFESPSLYRIPVVGMFATNMLAPWEESVSANLGVNTNFVVQFQYISVLASLVIIQAKTALLLVRVYALYSRWRMVRWILVALMVGEVDDAIAFNLPILIYECLLMGMVIAILLDVADAICKCLTHTSYSNIYEVCVIVFIQAIMGPRLALSMFEVKLERDTVYLFLQTYQFKVTATFEARKQALN
ncbi:hypothetical protein CONPUDRAFT_70528 [Coniophora puteana RWD-64-598 SS2]|uniref:DUF6533 domain-containing protein n=1 Tax=Coniophora puteana (strain RWD-64-598) TaxID=741705 RepID=A0A5M3N356_CONPW|nr:uncharacterized protein CONPUDRAFT_70528 [Coniophora puteana RWD-64-598 SS2]EIW85832.1 hypothetical protein CONPUDRAFT_70528 [Coniophora puteana RWD-64-598 SS2]